MCPGSFVVTGANGQIGRSTLVALAKSGVKPTALVRGRESLADCATVGDWLASDVALAAIREADTVVHLAGTLNPPDGNYENANIAPTERLAQALDPGRTRRLIFLSYVGASEKSRNRYLETKARAERLLRETQIPLTVFRCTHIIGSSEAPGPTASTMLLDGKSSVTVLGSGKQRVVPVFVGDVVAAILAALASDYSGTFDLQGPEEMTIDDLVRLLNRSDRVRISHVPGPIARLLRFLGPRLPSALIDAMLNDCRSENPTAQSTFNLSLTSLHRVWARCG
jgi:nucleoside-diphosphate-sugar epimerase